MAALSVAWVGGSPWAWLGGGIAATFGHAFSWHRRRRSLGAWTSVMALLVIALALVMRGNIVAALGGNWLPLAHFLLLVQAIASFDVRSRTGLYGGLSLSGTVLFFASQQAFGLSFGVFLLAYAGLLLTFLAVACLQDEQGKATAQSPAAIPWHPIPNGASLAGFWWVTGTAVVLLSVAAFLLLPRGERNEVGYTQAAALPVTGPGHERPAPEATGALSSLSEKDGAQEPPASAVAPNEAAGGLVAMDASALEVRSQAPGPSSGADARPGKSALSESAISAGGDGVVMHVRSPVVSYWRGQVFDDFDGRVWRPERGPERSGVPTYVGSNPMRYTQTYFMHQVKPGATFMGYRGVEVRSPADTAYGKPMGKGFSYQVLSVQPDFVPEKLRDDPPRRSPDRYYSVPSSMPWLPELAAQVTAGAGPGFGKAARIVDYLRRNGRYDDAASDQLRSSASLEEFLLGRAKGTSIDYATATVLLARAAGLPARLAVGYLPGERDVLSGAYEVRDEHAHAWAEISFEAHSWVPFDAHPHPDLVANGLTPPRAGQLAGINYLFETNVGDELLRRAAMAPSRLSRGARDAFGRPLSAGMAVVATAGIVVSLAWLGLRLAWRRRRPRSRHRGYSRLPGSARDEMLLTYRRVEKLLRKRGVCRRAPQQTLGEYAQAASEQSREVRWHLAWFVAMARSAAYDPRWVERDGPAHMLEEARARLASLRTALG